MTEHEDLPMEAAYLALGRLIAAECPAGFATASLRMEADGDRTQLSIGAVQPDGTRVQLQPAAATAQYILETLRGIRNSEAGEGGALWRNCTVTLKAGGGFAMEVEY
jgi:hypothetical protein